MHAAPRPAAGAAPARRVLTDLAGNVGHPGAAPARKKAHAPLGAADPNAKENLAAGSGKPGAAKREGVDPQPDNLPYRELMQMSGDVLRHLAAQRGMSTLGTEEELRTRIIAAQRSSLSLRLPLAARARAAGGAAKDPAPRRPAAGPGGRRCGSASPTRNRDEADAGGAARRAPLTARGPSPAAAAAVRRTQRDDLVALDYQEDIFKHFADAEGKHLPPVDYMAQTQVEITGDMRGICMDWVVECATRFKMHAATLFLTANVLDRFLAAKPIRRERMQLVAMVCLIIAAKYEEVYAPRIKDYIHISANHFTQADLLRYEHYVLHALNYTLTVPTPYSFLTQYLTHLGANGGGAPEPPSAKPLRDASVFLAECSMLKMDLYLRCRPSLLAAACVHAARQMLDLTPVWPDEVAAPCQWSAAEVAGVSTEVLEHARKVKRDGKLNATLNRYKEPPRSRIASRLS